MNPDGAGLTNLTNDLAQDVEPQWSPDGSKIVFTSSNRDGRTDNVRDVWVMNADGTGQTALTNSGGIPQWRPSS